MTEEETLQQRMKSEPALTFTVSFLESFTEAKLYLVGGAVRDVLIGRNMKELDFDFVVGGLSAEDLEAWLATKGEVGLFGKTFGVFKFMPSGFTHDQIEFIDIALPRTESMTEGSHGGYKDFEIQSDPHLSIEEDLSRRDFTVNAMAFDVREQQLIDPFNGRVDLDRHLIRTVGDPTERFNEDLSRMLRAVRFASELSFDIETETLKTIRERSEKINLMRKVEGSLVYIVPRETVGLELAKALERNPAGAVDWLEKSGLMQVLFPEIQRIIDVDQSYTLPLTQLKQDHLVIAVSLLLRAIDPDEIDQLLRATGLTTLPHQSIRRIDSSEIIWLIKHLHPPLTTEDIAHMPGAQFEKWFMNGHSAHFLTIMNHLGHSRATSAVQDRRSAIESRWLVDQTERIPPLLSGDDIMNAGVEQGPKIRKILDDCRSAQLGGELMTREQALKWVKERV
jgi:tRNA nucleotidyltransferase/poly(A) polymerase